jgi:hypothetical protein
MQDVIAAYEQLKNNPSLVFVPGEYEDEAGIWTWQSYTQSRFPKPNINGLILTLCFVPSRISEITFNFYQYYVEATPDRVALVALDPTRNIFGGLAVESQICSPQERQRLLQQWIKDPFS